MMRFLLILIVSCASALGANVTNVWSGLQVWPGFQVTTVASAPSGGGSSNTFYVDAVAGSDSNPGTLAQPFKTLAKANSYNPVGGTIYVHRSKPVSHNAQGQPVYDPYTVYRESILVQSNCNLIAYGTGEKACISGADLLTNANFSLASGQSKTYQYPLTVSGVQSYWSQSWYTNVNMFWENDTRCGYGGWPGNGIQPTSVAQVEANAGTFWYDTSGHILYVHLTGDRNPATNSNVYEWSHRFDGVNGLQGFTFQDLCVEKVYIKDDHSGGDYQIKWMVDGTINRCVGRYGFNHLIGVADTNAASISYVTNTYTYDVEESTAHAPTLFVAYKSSLTDVGGTAPTVRFDNCTAEQKPTANALTAEGFLSHDTGGNNAVRAIIGSGYAINCQIGADCSHNLLAPTNLTVICCGVGINGGNTVFGPFNIYNYTNLNGVGVSYGWFNPPTNGMLYGGLISDVGAGLSGVSAPCHVTNTVFVSITNSSMIGINASSLPNSVDSVANTFSGLSVAYFVNSPGGSAVSFSDYNDFWATPIADSPNVSLTTWRSSFPSFDAHSVTTQPALPSLAWPTNQARAVCADAPMMLLNPVSQSVLTNTVFSLSASAAGINTLYYQWTHAGTNLPGATGTSYSMTASNGCDGSYACIITNDIWGTTSTVATVTITQPFIWSPTNTLNSGPAVAWWRVTGNYSTNAGVAKLTDLTGNGYALQSAGSAGTFPRRTASAVNGMDSLLFKNSLATYLTNVGGAMVYNQNIDVFMVASVTNDASASRRYLWCSTNSSAVSWTIYPDGGGFENQSFLVTASPLTNTWAIFDQQYSGATSTLYTNNIGGALVNGGSSPLKGFVLGGRFDLTGNGSFAFAEGIAFTNLSAADRTNCYNYLNAATNYNHIGP